MPADPEPPAQIVRERADIRSLPTSHLGDVCLRLIVHVLDQPRGESHRHRQHARSERIQRSRMPDAPYAGQAPHQRDDRERRYAGWLIDDEEPVIRAHTRTITNAVTG